MAQVSYKQEYYSPEHVRLYIGPIWIDDCISIEYNHLDTKEQLYDHRAKFFNLIAPGQNMVQGQFTLAIRDIDPILKVVNMIYNHGNNLSDAVFVKKVLQLERLKNSFEPFNVVRNPIIGYNTQQDNLLFMSASYDTITEFETSNTSLTFNDILDVPLFDIYLIYGNPNNPNGNATVNVISNVAILSISKDFGLDMNAIHTYVFLGRVLDKPFNYSMLISPKTPESEIKEIPQPTEETGPNTQNPEEPPYEPEPDMGYGIESDLTPADKLACLTSFETAYGSYRSHNGYIKTRYGTGNEKERLVKGEVKIEYHWSLDGNDELELYIRNNSSSIWEDLYFQVLFEPSFVNYVSGASKGPENTIYYLNERSQEPALSVQTSETTLRPNDFITYNINFKRQQDQTFAIVVFYAFQDENFSIGKNDFGNPILPELMYKVHIFVESEQSDGIYSRSYPSFNNSSLTIAPSLQHISGSEYIFNLQILNRHDNAWGDLNSFKNSYVMILCDSLVPIAGGLIGFTEKNGTFYPTATNIQAGSEWSGQIRLNLLQVNADCRFRIHIEGIFSEYGQFSSDIDFDVFNIK